MLRLLPVALAALLSACAGIERTPDAEPVALRLPGFSATAPAARGWILTPGTATAQAAVRSVEENRTLVAFASVYEPSNINPCENRLRPVICRAW